ncbi:MAG: hypothetical protein ACYDA9_13765 [Terriglobia bacterium]
MAAAVDVTNARYHRAPRAQSSVGKATVRPRLHLTQWMNFKSTPTPKSGMELIMKFKTYIALKSNLFALCCIALILTFALPAFSQSTSDQDSIPTQKESKKKKKKTNKGPGKEMGQGGEDIGKGTAKGAADLGEGAVGTAGNLATGNVIGAGISAGKGVVGAGTHVGIGAAKGTYKIGKGAGGIIKKLAGKSKKKDESGS